MNMKYEDVINALVEVARRAAIMVQNANSAYANKNEGGYMRVPFQDYAHLCESLTPLDSIPNYGINDVPGWEKARLFLQPLKINVMGDVPAVEAKDTTELDALLAAGKNSPAIPILAKGREAELQEKLTTAQLALQAAGYTWQPRLGCWQAPAAQAPNSDLLYHIESQVRRLAAYQLAMSYNDSYFGEPAGLVKRVTEELVHAFENHRAGRTEPAKDWGKGKESPSSGHPLEHRVRDLEARLNQVFEWKAKAAADIAEVAQRVRTAMGVTTVDLNKSQAFSVTIGPDAPPVQVDQKKVLARIKGNVTGPGHLLPPNRYTHVDKGGTYEIVGLAHGAGTLATMLPLMVYRNDSGELYFRDSPDFAARMKPMKESDEVAPANAYRALADVALIEAINKVKDAYGTPAARFLIKHVAGVDKVSDIPSKRRVAMISACEAYVSMRNE